MQNISVLFFGMAISFLGQLPVGTISITATQIAVQENFSNAWKYSFGVALIEMIYLRLVLSGVKWIVGHQGIFTLFTWITIIFFLVLGLRSFISARQQEETRKALFLNNRLDRFLLGVTMSALNPAQIPFWIIWTGYFLNLGWLKPDFTIFNFFTAGSGIGTIGGLIVYMYAGNWLVTKMNTSNRTLNQIMGIVFMIAALTQLYRVLNP
jgi:threonine/homoserine/homoserine lactone efflux protein